jgi:thioesterase domain-containing protein/acyl carrier protein
LYLGGVQVARGYLNRPELTQERFLSDPFAREPGARMYRTGDWSRWLPDGELDFLGRKDDQIQIRGYRVELGEIEGLLFAHPEVQQVCCVPQMVDGMPTGIVAHVVPKTAGSDIAETVRQHLAVELPEYMLPSQIFLHERLPLTPQGKADRAAMKAMPAGPEKNTGKIQPGDGLGKALWSLWSSLLPAALNSPPEATFAVLGGDSLLAVKLVLGIEEAIGQRLEVSTFLVQPTFDGLCRAVQARMEQNEFQPVITLRRQGSRPPLFFLYGHTGDIEVYFGLAHALGEDQPIYGIRSPVLQNPAHLPPSIEAAAAEALQFIRKAQPHGAPAIVGYSWAGVLAFEIARQLSEKENLDCFTAMLGPEAPMAETTFGSRLWHFLRFFPGWLKDLLGDSQHRWRRLARWRKMAADTTQNIAAAKIDMPDWAQSPISRHLIGLTENYRPQTKPDISVDVFRERDEYTVRPHPLRAWQTNHLRDGGWNRWTRRPNHIHWLNGDHGTVLRPPQVSDLARAIREAHDRHLRSAGPSATAPDRTSQHLQQLGSQLPLLMLWTGASLGV